MKKTKSLGVALLFLLISILTLSPFSTKAQDVTVYIDSTAQYIRGFGAANIVDWYGPDLTLDEVDAVYGTGEGELGFNILRLRISPNPDDWDNGNQVETARKVHEMGGIVWAAPWNPPASMYDPNSEQRKVDPEKYGEYAQHLNDFVAYMEENGVPIYAISVQNEPDYADDWTAWDPEDIVTFLRDHGDSINARVIAPESFQFRLSYSDPILNDSLAAANTDIIGGHIYGGGIGDYPLAREKGKEVWMTEHYTSSDRSANIWPDALEVGSEIQSVMKVNWNAYIWWQIKRYYSPIHDGVDVEDPDVDFEDNAQNGDITKRGWVMSQFSRFIRPGFNRIYSNGPFGRGYNTGVPFTAYIDSARKQVVVVGVNEYSSPREVNINLVGAAANKFSRYITSADQNAEQLDDIEATNGSVTTTLPGNSIVTFVSSDLMAVSNEEELVSTPTGLQLNQNYPNPFNPTTMISYQIPVSSEVSLKVYDMLGREVASLVDNRVAAGEYQVQFDASHLSSGIYIYQLKTGDVSQTRQMTLIK